MGREATKVPKKILVAVDMSKLSEKLVAYGHSLATRLDAEVTFLHVLPHPYLWKGYEPWIPKDLDSEIHVIAEKKIRYYLKKAEEQFPGLPDHPHHVQVMEGNPADAVIKMAKEDGFNLIVVGYRGHSPIERLVVGSTATNVARYAHCSVLIYRPGYEVF